MQIDTKRVCVEMVPLPLESVSLKDESGSIALKSTEEGRQRKKNISSGVHYHKQHSLEVNASDPQVGQSSGVIAVLSTIGSGVGYALFGVLQIPLAQIYILFIVCLFGCLIVSLVFIVELYAEFCNHGSDRAGHQWIPTQPSKFRSLFLVSYAVIFLSVSALCSKAIDVIFSVTQYVGNCLCCENEGSPVRSSRQETSPRYRSLGKISTMCYHYFGRPATRAKAETNAGDVGGGAHSQRQLLIASNGNNNATPRPREDTPSKPTVVRSCRQTPSSMSILWTGVTSAYTIPNPWKYPDFFFACSSRLLFNVALSGQVHLYYYFRDVLIPKVHQAPDAPQLNPVHMTSYLAVMALVGGSLAAIPAGYFSDRVLGKKSLVYIAVGCCIASLILFLTVDEIQDNGSGMQTIHTIQHIGILYGAGNVSYLTVDYAIGVLSLPHRGTRGSGMINTASNTHPSCQHNHHAQVNASLPDTLHPHVDASSAKNLGVFSMSATLGQLFGQLLFATLLDLFSLDMIVSPTTTVTAYKKSGFVCIYSLGGLFFLLSAVAVAFIKNVH